MFSTAFQTLYVALPLIATLLALVRWRRTPQGDLERGARRDMAQLCGIVLLGVCVALVRERFPTRSAGFWVCNALLVPALIGGVVGLRRLLRAYRKSQ